MKTKVTFLLIISLLFSCKNYNNKNYIKKENEAIQDIIIQLIQYEEITKANDFNNKKLKLYVLNSLGSEINKIYEPEGVLISVDGIQLADSIIKKGKKNYNEDYKEYKKEKKKFRPFLYNLIKERELNFKLSNPNLIIKQVSEEVYRKEMANFDGSHGFLGISRIAFNSNFDKGYLSYGFFCGASCAWSDNIEIKKRDGKWKITKKFSGGIA